jgi:hypothetical protein
VGGEGVDRVTYPQGNRKDQDRDQERRAAAQSRKPLIANWDPSIPAGYIHVDDAIVYIQRRWGNALCAEVLEAFSRDDSGPKWTIFGDWPDKSRGERYYEFNDIDIWVYRTFTGVPASWQETRRIKSSVPIRRIQLGDAPPTSDLDVVELRNGEEQSDGGTGIEKDGRRGH